MRLFLITISLLFLGLWPTDVYAQACTPSGFAGFWKNVRAETKTLSVLEVVDRCDDNGRLDRLEVRALERCHPRDCSWGWTRGNVDREGVLTATFQTFIAARHISAVRQGQRMQLKVYTDFISDQKDDKNTSYILVRISR